MSAENFDTRVSFIILSGLADMSVWLGCSGWPFLVGTSLKSMNKSLLVIFVVVIMSTLSYLTINFPTFLVLFLVLFNLGAVFTSCPQNSLQHPLIL